MDSMRSDEEFRALLSAAQAGGEWAVTSLFRDLNPRLVRYLRARVGQEADDVAADTWLDIARNLASFEGDEDDFRAWAFTIAHRRAIDSRRRQSRRPPLTPADQTLA